MRDSQKISVGRKPGERNRNSSPKSLTVSSILNAGGLEGGKASHLFQFALCPSVPPSACRPARPPSPFLTARIPPSTLHGFLLGPAPQLTQPERGKPQRLPETSRGGKNKATSTCLQLLESWHRYSGKKCTVVYRNVMNVFTFQLEGERRSEVCRCARRVFFFFSVLCVKKNVCLCAFFVAAPVVVEHGAFSSA